MVNKERIKLWVDALRSGEYEQGKQLLCHMNMYCCLGVACEVAIQNGLEVEKSTSNCEVRYDGEYAYPPLRVMEFYGINQSDPKIFMKSGEKRISSLNDNEGLTFLEIADLLEKQFLSQEIPNE